MIQPVSTAVRPSSNGPRTLHPASHPSSPAPRPLPRLRRWAKEPFVRPYRCAAWHWPLEVKKDGWVRTTFYNNEGVRLAGLFGTAPGEARGTVVCAHPLRRDAKGFFLKHGHADLLRKAGFHVLLFDFNGFGESACGTCRFPLDVLAAVRHARRLAPGRPVGVLGCSFGAAWALCALAHSNHGIQAVVAEGPFVSLSDYYRSRKLLRTVLHLAQRLLPREASRLHPLLRLYDARDVRSLLFIYGEHDTVTPPTLGTRFMKACADNWERGPGCPTWMPWPSVDYDLWCVPEALHNLAAVAAPEAYAERVTSVFQHAFDRGPDVHFPHHAGNGLSRNGSAAVGRPETIRTG